ncbi:hypothetical protein M23134_07088 [Microscilla marina ATCC 23134]|uniref:Uncharacterized protein n=1 Tax=Microscilla marina ATCC 23134 TaxID=313606 RepID=A1ZUC4_MICM2|nr:hypothetical protein M23134_07088 [Microscilla marina ATCC 23134]
MKNITKQTSKKTQKLSAKEMQNLKGGSKRIYVGNLPGGG